MLPAIVLTAALLSSPTPPPSPQASSAASRCSDVDSISFEDAFRYDIRDAAMLQQVAAFAAVPPARQRATFDAAAAADSPPACLSASQGHAAARALTLIANIWKVDELGDEAKFAAFSHTIEAAFASPTLPASLAAALPVMPPQTTACATPDQTAAVLHVVQPQYTVPAMVARTSGRVMVEVRLDPSGLVRNAHVYGATVGDAPEGQQLAREALMGAAATTYRPACVANRAVGGRYLFVADFMEKR